MCLIRVEKSYFMRKGEKENWITVEGTHKKWKYTLYVCPLPSLLLLLKESNASAVNYGQRSLRYVAEFMSLYDIKNPYFESYREFHFCLYTMLLCLKKGEDCQKGAISTRLSDSCLISIFKRLKKKEAFQFVCVIFLLVQIIW